MLGTSTKPKPLDAAYGLRALGRGDLPAALSIRGERFHRVTTVKHDFFAATGFYENKAGARVVLKVGRTEDYAGVPMRWLGRRLCRREMRFYRKLSDVPGVPALLGTVGETGFVHEYVSGEPLRRGLAVPRGFFDALEDLLREVHRRDIAYVDTNKCPNILLGDDGAPHLIDFQISWDLDELGDTSLNRWLLRRLQREDRYHVLKHKKRLCPEELTAEERDVVMRKSALIRLHRMITAPYFRLRRAIFRRLRETGRLIPEGSQ